MATMNVVYDKDYCPEAPYIFYYQLSNGYMIGGEYKSKEEAENYREWCLMMYGPEKLNTVYWEK